MEVRITERRRIKRASASLRQGCIHVQVPRHWPKTLKHEAVSELVEKVLAGEQRQEKLLNSPAAHGPRITLRTPSELEAYVRRINAETFNLTLGKIRMGQARYTQLAQLNLRTKTMTVSRFCLNDVPESALRYLIIHELAHYYEARHNKAFWGHVARFVPDYRFQSRLIKAFHKKAVAEDECPPLEAGINGPEYPDLIEEDATDPVAATEEPLPQVQPSLLGWLFTPVRQAIQTRLFD